MRAILTSLSIRQKLLISSLLYILPLAVLLYFTVSGIRSDIQFAETEKRGAKILRPLGELMALLPEHRSLAFLQSQGKTEPDGRLKDTAKRIDASFAALLAESATADDALKLDGESMKPPQTEGNGPAAIKESWDKLRPRIGELIPEMIELEHTTIIAAVQTLIARVGDTSKLILDPELASSYLADTMLGAIPQALEQLGELTLTGQQILSRGKPEGRDLPRLELLSAAINSGSLRRMEKSFTAAVRYDSQARGDSSTLGQGAAKSLQKCSDSIRFLLQSAHVLKGNSGTGALREFTMLGAVTLESVDKFGAETLRELDLLLDDRIERFRQRMYTILFLACFCLALAGLLVFMISRGITRPLERVMSVAGEIAEGNINGARARIDALGMGEAGPVRGGKEERSRFKDEIWQLASVFVHMTHSLDSLVLQVQRSGVQVAASSAEISAASRQIEATAAQQAASTSEVNATAKEISASCRVLLESVNRVLALASETLSLAQEGQERLAGMKATMGALMKATSSISSQLDGISRTTGGIGSVITTMTKVADQTNLLSLNATIEAEKAGKYGLGFSVVAREIQRLADQTAVSTLDIEKLVRTTEATTSAGVAEMDEFVRQVRETVQEVETIGSGLVSSIIDHLRELIPRFEELGGAMDAQSAGAEEISGAIGLLSEGAEQIRQVINEFSGVTQHLITAADGLRQEVSRFNASSPADAGPA